MIRLDTEQDMRAATARLERVFATFPGGALIEPRAAEPPYAVFATVGDPYASDVSPLVWECTDVFEPFPCRLWSVGGFYTATVRVWRVPQFVFDLLHYHRTKNFTVRASSVQRELAQPPTGAQMTSWLADQLSGSWLIDEPGSPGAGVHDAVKAACAALGWQRVADLVATLPVYDLSRDDLAATLRTLAATPALRLPG